MRTLFKECATVTRVYTVYKRLRMWEVG